MTCPRLAEIAINPIVVAFTFLVVPMTALLCGADADASCQRARG